MRKFIIIRDWYVSMWRVKKLEALGYRVLISLK
jgi:hypothetical protein